MNALIFYALQTIGHELLIADSSLEIKLNINFQMVDFKTFCLLASLAKRVATSDSVVVAAIDNAKSSTIIQDLKKAKVFVFFVNFT